MATLNSRPTHQGVTVTRSGATRVSMKILSGMRAGMRAVMLVEVTLTVFSLAVLSGCGQESRESSPGVWPAENPSEAALPEIVLPGPTLPEPAMTEFADPDAGFVARVPVGWRRVNLYEQGDTGFSVSFESPPSRPDDQFSDYLLIEILPDDPALSFEFAPTERTTMLVAGNRVYRERYELPDYRVKDARLNLVAWQIIYREPGYSVGIYAVGESREDSRLERLIIEFAHSLRIVNAPFKLS